MIGKYEKFGRAIDRCQSPIERAFLVELLLVGHHSFDVAAGDACVARTPAGVELGQQVRVGKYFIDFTLSRGDQRYAIELDGFVHHGSTPEQFERDSRRQREITAAGWTVIRFSGREIVHDVARCAREAMSMASERGSPRACGALAARRGAFSTGLLNVDAMLGGGLRPYETSVLAARADVGATTLALGMCEGILRATPSGGALYVSAERHEDLAARMIASHAGVPLAALRRKVLNKRQWDAMVVAVSDARGLELHYAAARVDSMQDVRVAASELQRALAARDKTLAIVTVEVSALKASEQSLGSTCQAMRALASDLGCHVMALARVTLRTGKCADTMPNVRRWLSALSDAEADQILVMHRDPVFRAGKPTAVALAKERMTGETAITLLEYQNGRYVDSSKDFDDEYGESGDGD